MIKRTLLLAAFILTNPNAEDFKTLGEFAGAKLSYSQELVDPRFVEYEGQIFLGEGERRQVVAKQSDFEMERYEWNEENSIFLVFWRNNKAGNILRIEALRIKEGKAQKLKFGDSEFVDAAQGRASLEGQILTCTEVLAYYRNDQLNASIETNFELNEQGFVFKSEEEVGADDSLGQLELAARSLDKKDFSKAKSLYESLIPSTALKLKSISKTLHDQVQYDYARTLVGAGDEGKAKEVLSTLNEGSAFSGRAKALLDTL